MHRMPHICTLEYQKKTCKKGTDCVGAPSRIDFVIIDNILPHFEFLAVKSMEYFKGFEAVFREAL